MALPNKMSFVQRKAPSSGLFGILPIGRSFTSFVTSSKQVYNSKGVSTAPLMIFCRADFVVSTIDSEHPSWCGPKG